MNFKQQLNLVKEYFGLVQEDRAEPLYCPVDQALVLHYVDHKTDEIYFKCTVCGRTTYPGSFFYRALQNAIKQANKEN